MLNIMKSDVYRIFKGKSIYISIILIIVMIVLSTFELFPGWIRVNNSLLDDGYKTKMSDIDNRKLYKANSRRKKNHEEVSL